MLSGYGKSEAVHESILFSVHLKVMNSLDREAQAAQIVIAKVRPILVSHAKNAKVIEKELEPVLGFHWNKQLMIKVGSGIINDFLHCVKGTSLAKDKISLIKQRFKGTFYEEIGPIPLHWELWRSLITIYLLYELTPFHEWMKIVASLESSYLFAPLDLAVLSYLESLALDNHHESKGNIVILWQSALCWREKNPADRTIAKNLQEVDLAKMIKQLRVDSVPETSYFKEWDIERARLGLPKDFSSRPPRAQMGLLADTGADTAVLEHFLLLGTRVNYVRSVEGSLRCVSSGINSYASFCSLVCRPFLPPTEANVLHWSSIFRPGATYRNYLGHLKKACFLAGSPVDWYTSAVRDVSKGLRLAKKGSFKFPNFIYTQDLFRIINGLGWEDCFSKLAFVSFLFSLRIPSEALCMRQAHDSERLADFVPQGDKVLIGVRVCGGAPCLIVKMSWRKNIPGGCILKRVCLCSDSSRRARKICPPHRIWPLLRASGGPGELLFPEFTRHNVNRKLKFTLAKLGFPDGHKFTSKAFRRGATQELLMTGNSLEVIKGSGGCWGSSFRSYVDLEMDHAFRISRALIALSDSDSSDQGDLPKAASADQKRRRKWRHTHARAPSQTSSASETSSSIRVL